MRIRSSSPRINSTRQSASRPHCPTCVHSFRVPSSTWTRASLTLLILSRSYKTIIIAPATTRCSLIKQACHPMTPERRTRGCRARSHSDLTPGSRWRRSSWPSQLTSTVRFRTTTPILISRRTRSCCRGSWGRLPRRIIILCTLLGRGSQVYRRIQVMPLTKSSRW